MKRFGKAGSVPSAGPTVERPRAPEPREFSCVVLGVCRVVGPRAVVAVGGLIVPVAAESQVTPTVTVAADAASVEEGEVASFTLTRTAPLDAALTVSLDVSASRFTAFSSLLGAKPVTFAADQDTVAYSVSTFDNARFQEEPGTDDPSQFVFLVIQASTDSSYTVGADGSAIVSVTDNDEVVEYSIVVPDGGFRVPEGGGSLSFSVSATTLTAGSPTDNSYTVSALTDVHHSAYSPEDYSPLSEVVPFAASGWSTIMVEGETRYRATKSVTLDVVDDRIAEGDETFDLVLQPPLGGTIPPFGVKTTVVTIVDDDTAGVTVSPTSMTVTEGATKTYTLVLTSQPEFDDVVVVVSPPSGTDVSADSSLLVFTPDTWETAQTVTVSVVDDDDAVVDAKATIDHSAIGGGYGSVSVDGVEVTIAENDVADVMVSPTSLAVTEGSTAAYTVRLTSTPTANVEVTVSLPSNAGLTADKTSLTFSSTTWSTEQTVTVTAADDEDALTNAPVTISHGVSGGDYVSVTADSVSVTIKENDAAGVTVSPTTLSVPEGSTGAYTVELTSAPTANVVVAVSVPANMGVTANKTSLTFTTTNWATKQTVSVTAADDDNAVVESPVTISHSASGGGYGSVSVDSVTVSVTETETAGVTLSATAMNLTEGAMETYTVKLTSQPSADVVITVTPPTGGEASVNKTSLTFSSTTWQTAQTVTVTATPDDDATMGSAVSITHSAAGGGYSSVSVASVRVTITEDEMVGVSVSPPTLAVVEGSTNTYLVRLMSQPTADVEVAISVPSNVDVSANRTVLTFTSTTWNSVQTVTVTADQDSNYTTNASVTITHSASGGDYDMVSVPSVVVDVAEDDRQASVAAGRATVTEGGNAAFTVSLAGGDALAPVVVSYSVGGTAVSGADYRAPSGSVTIGTGGDNERFTIATKSDAVLDAGETLIVSLTGATTVKGMVSVGATTATTTITDPGMVTVSVAAASASEGAALEFPVTLSGKVASDVVLGWSTSAGTAVSGTDYTAVTSGSLTIAAGDTSGTLTVATDLDTLTEADETLTVAITGTLPDGVSLGVSTAEGTITDDDALTAAVTADQLAVTEGSSALFTVTLTGGTSTAAVEVSYSIGGTATEVSDYETPTGNLTIGPGAGSGTIDIATREDDIEEPGETLILTLTGTATAKGSTRVDETPATVTVENQSRGPSGELDQLSLSASPSTVAEAGGDRTIEVAAVLGGAPRALAVTVKVTVTGGTATDGLDFASVEPFDVTIPANVSSGRASFTLAPIVDSETEPAETIALTGVADVSGLRVTPTEVTITDSSSDRPTVTIAAGPSPVSEGSPVEFTVTRSLASGDLPAVQVTISETGSVLAGASPAEVSFGEGETTSLLRLETIDDQLGEPDSEVRATLEEGDGYALGTEASATVTVTDNDSAPHLTIEPASAVEGEGSVTLVARLSRPAERPLTVVWTTADGTAAAGEDYVQTSGVLHFPAGVIEVRFTVELIVDQFGEDDENFMILLTDPEMTVDPEPMPVMIIDDDEAPVQVALTLDRERVSEREGATAVSVTATLAGGLWNRKTLVEVEVAGGGRAGAVDFDPVDPFEIAIPAGESSASARFILAPEDDRVDEEDETIEVSGSSMLPVLPATLVLEDDDERSRSIALASAPEVVAEDGGPAMVEVTAALDLSVRSVDTPVRVVLSNSGEPGAVDYRAVDVFELTIPAGEQSGSVSFTLTPENDRVDEFHEAIRLAGTSVLPVSPASLLLQDDDEPSETILLTVAPEVVLEDGGPTMVTVTASFDRSARVVETPVRVEVVGSGRSGVVGFEPVEAFALSIPAEEMSGSDTFVLTPVNDMEEARHEAVEVRGEADLPVSPALLSLLDDDDASLARAWLGRFARTVASQAVEAVEERLEGRSAAADHLTLAGQRIVAGPTPMGGTVAGGGSLGSGLSGSSSLGGLAGWGGRGRSFSLSRYPADQRWDLLARTTFSLSSSAGADESGDGSGAGNWTAWGRGALTNFRGAEDDLSLRGDVVTGLVGMDYESGRFLSGLAVGFSRGNGGFSGGAEAEASLTGGYPYMRIQVGENLSLWGVLGYGRGEFSLTEENGRIKETDIALAMGALGLRRDLVSSARGFGLGLLSDVLLARIDSDPVPGLAAVGEQVKRLRLTVEGSYDRALAGGGALMPTLELGVRYDGGDAERGLGVEAGAGLRYSNVERGLRIELAGRSLVTHEASGFEEWGGSGSVTLDPGESGRGLALGLRSSWGAAHGGMQQLWSQQQMFDGAGRPSLQQGGRFEAEAGYGFGRAGGRLLVSPYGVLMLAEEAERGTGVGVRLDFARSFSLSLEVSRRRFAGAESEGAMILSGTLRRGPRRREAAGAAAAVRAAGAER